MKTLVSLLLCITTVSISNAQSTDIIGTWKIVEYKNTVDGKEVKMSEDELTKEGSVWDLIFKDEKNVVQISNMRTGSVETQEGTWIKTDKNLTLILEFNNRKIELVYKYELSEKTIVLKRSHPAGTWQVASKFKKQ